MIRYEIQKKNGFRGYNFIAETIVTDKGEPITEKTKEGTDMITITTQIHIPKSDGRLTEEIKSDLALAIDKEINKLKPIYEV